MLSNNRIKTILLTAFTMLSMQMYSQNVISTSFQVDGICGMCEARILNAVDVKGVKSSSYDLDTHTLSIAYQSKRISEDEIHALLNAAGHDTEKSRATDEQYDTVHDCCKYREHENH